MVAVGECECISLTKEKVKWEVPPKVRQAFGPVTRGATADDQVQPQALFLGLLTYHCQDCAESLGFPHLQWEVPTMQSRRKFHHCSSCLLCITSMT